MKFLSNIYFVDFEVKLWEKIESWLVFMKSVYLIDREDIFKLDEFGEEVDDFVLLEVLQRNKFMR